MRVTIKNDVHITYIYKNAYTNIKASPQKKYIPKNQ